MEDPNFKEVCLAWSAWVNWFSPMQGLTFFLGTVVKHLMITALWTYLVRAVLKHKSVSLSTGIHSDKCVLGWALCTSVIRGALAREPRWCRSAHLMWPLDAIKSYVNADVWGCQLWNLAYYVHRVHSKATRAAVKTKPSERLSPNHQGLMPCFHVTSAVLGLYVQGRANPWETHHILKLCLEVNVTKT